MAYDSRGIQEQPLEERSHLDMRTLGSPWHILGTGGMSMRTYSSKSWLTEHT